jgi:hypothetical protein
MLVEDALSIVGMIALGWAALGALGWVRMIMRYGYERGDLAFLPMCAILGPIALILSSLR